MLVSGAFRGVPSPGTKGPMAVFELPLEVKDELLVLKRDASHPDAIRNVLRRGHRLFQVLYGGANHRVEETVVSQGLGHRLREVLARIAWVKGEVLFHVDLRCQAYDHLLRAHRLAPRDPEILASLLRLELTHSKLREASMHLFQARAVRDQIPDFDLYEEELESCLEDDLENELRSRIGDNATRLRREPGDARALADLAADYFYDVLDLRRASSLIAHALAAPGADAEAWFLGAEIAFEEQKPHLALERLARMIEANPCDYRGRMLQANVLASLDRREEALAALRQLVGRLDQPIRLICQDVFFQADLGEEEEYHRIWLELLRRGQLAEDGIGYFYSAGTPLGFLEDTPRARRIYHRSRLLSVKFREGDLVAEIEAGFRRLLDEAPEYTFLLDEYARFLLSSAPSDSPGVALASELAEKAVSLSEAAGEPEDRFRATLDAVRQVTGGRG